MDYMYYPLAAGDIGGATQAKQISTHEPPGFVRVVFLAPGLHVYTKKEFYSFFRKSSAYYPLERLLIILK